MSGAKITILGKLSSQQTESKNWNNSRFSKLAFWRCSAKKALAQSVRWTNMNLPFVDLVQARRAAWHQPVRAFLSYFLHNQKCNHKIAIFHRFWTEQDGLRDWLQRPAVLRRTLPARKGGKHTIDGGNRPRRKRERSTGRRTFCRQETTLLWNLCACSYRSSHNQWRRYCQGRDEVHWLRPDNVSNERRNLHRLHILQSSLQMRQQ